MKLKQGDFQTYWSHDKAADPENDEMYWSEDFCGFYESFCYRMDSWAK